VGSRTLRVLSPLFRYSAARDAWVLRLVGRRVGPALTFNERRDKLAR
jgi:hypothetical protein